MIVSLIIPVLNEEENVPHLWERLATVTGGIPDCDFQVIFVDDGSRDATAERIQALPANAHLSWTLVQFSRNFGHQVAISAGMRYADGDAIVFLDADLQDPPEMIPAFLAKFREGYDVVYGIRQNRKEPLWLRFCFSAFYRLFNAIAEQPMPLDVGDFSLISKRVARLIGEMPERDRLIRGLRSWVGFKQIGIPYDRPERAAGTSSYGIARYLRLALDGLFSFSKVPIHFSLAVGALVMLVAGIYLAKVYVSWLFFGASAPQGWTSLITLGFIAAGANIVATSIVGEYVCRIYFQTKARPLYVIKAIQQAPGKGPAVPPPSA